MSDISDDPATRKPTREQRQAICAALDQRYDVENQRYRADQSDIKVAETLQYPRVWVTELRVDLYGDHDRNEMAERQLKAVEDAIALAEQATERLMAMAQEAEALASQLKGLQQRLKG